jgi:hypothetical protein
MQRHEGAPGPGRSHLLPAFLTTKLEVQARKGHGTFEDLIIETVANLVQRPFHIRF